jgi:hypothetical protein
VLLGWVVMKYFLISAAWEDNPVDDLKKNNKNFAFNLEVKLSVELGYVFLSLRL